MAIDTDEKRAVIEAAFDACHAANNAALKAAMRTGGDIDGEPKTARQTAASDTEAKRRGGVVNTAAAALVAALNA